MRDDHPQLRRFEPPEGYVRVESALDGVEVFAPAPEVEEADKPRTFRCAQCGATTAFDAKLGVLHCRFCGHKEEPEGAAVGESGGSEFTIAALEVGGSGLGVERKELVCGQCAGVLVLADGALTATCPFCASNEVHVNPETAPGLTPQFVLPFQVEPGRIQELAKAWLGGGWMHPPDLQKVARVDGFVGMYVPYWLFTAVLGSDWECEVGTDRTEHYTDSDGNRQSRTVTTWKWKSGSLRDTWRDVAVPGSTRIAALDRVGSFPFDQLEPYAASFLAGWSAVTYDETLPDAWEKGRAQMRAEAAARCKSAAGGDRQRNFSMSADLDDETWRYALLPVYVSAYKFRDETWVVVVNGATGTVGGQRPVAWGRVWLAIAACLTPGLFTGICIGVPTLFAFGIGVFVWMLALIFLAVGGVFAYNIYSSAVAEETL